MLGEQTISEHNQDSNAKILALKMDNKESIVSNTGSMVKMPQFLSQKRLDSSGTLKDLKDSTELNR